MVKAQAVIARAYGLLVVTLQGDRISAITWFFDRASSPTSGSPGRFTSEEIEWKAIDVGV